MIKDIVVNLNVGGCSCKDPQCAAPFSDTFRHIEGCGHGAFGSEREGREQNAFDRKEQADRGQEIEHRSEFELLGARCLRCWRGWR